MTLIFLFFNNNVAKALCVESCKITLKSQCSELPIDVSFPHQ